MTAYEGPDFAARRLLWPAPPHAARRGAGDDDRAGELSFLRGGSPASGSRQASRDSLSSATRHKAPHFTKQGRVYWSRHIG